ncbi:Transcription factor bHLH30 [Apostasia shenzhenica]|uniref:Transcription factor bHLH30 n=1 Tax=Apostasia shenzhenica TaxID=1088818 RepID=A0A2I0AIW5_9ASPA|nr:Transcription factor bHLH30 [Apostasia shenzhenica]
METDGNVVPVASSSSPAGRSCRSHSEAERKRRQRINGHLATLRSLLPAATRMDKATLLAEVVRHVRELRRRADDVAFTSLPSEGDEVGFEEDEDSRAGGVGGGERVKAWVCCADRPGLMAELNRAVGSSRARAVRAEVTTIGGRTRSVLELELPGGPAPVGVEARSAIQAALRAVVLEDRSGSADRFKRQRLSNRFSTATFNNNN